jgi:hypothetical protein
MKNYLEDDEKLQKIIKILELGEILMISITKDEEEFNDKE